MLQHSIHKIHEQHILPRHRKNTLTVYIPYIQIGSCFKSIFGGSRISLPPWIFTTSLYSLLPLFHPINSSHCGCCPMCVRLPDWCLLFTQALMWVIAGTACNLKWRRNDLVPLGAAATPLSAPQPGAPWAPYMETSGREGGGPCRLGRLGCKRNKKM